MQTKTITLPTTKIIYLGELQKIEYTKECTSTFLNSKFAPILFTNRKSDFVCSDAIIMVINDTNCIITWQKSIENFGENILVDQFLSNQIVLEYSLTFRLLESKLKEAKKQSNIFWPRSLSRRLLDNKSEVEYCSMRLNFLFI